MRHLVLEELSSLDEEARTDSSLLRKVDLDLTTTPSTVSSLYHVVIELVDGLGTWTSSNVQHQTELRFKVLTDALEKPSVAVNLAVISLLESEDEVDSHPVRGVSQSEVPSLELKQVHEVVELRKLFVVLYQLTQLSHDALLLISGIRFHEVAILE